MMKQILVVTYFVFIFLNAAKAESVREIIARKEAREREDTSKKKYFIYKSKDNQLAICNINNTNQCNYIKIPRGTIYAVDKNFIYLHDINSSSYRSCELNEKQLFNCTLSLVDNFKTNKMAVVHSRLYMLGDTVRSCRISRSHNIGDCINENHLPVNLNNSDEHYTKIQSAPSKQNKIILTKKTATSLTSIICGIGIKDGQLASCSEMKSGNYQAIPGERQHIYRLEPGRKKIMICIYDTNSTAVSNCAPAVTNFDLAADDMAFVEYYNYEKMMRPVGGSIKVRRNHRNVFIRDIKKNSLVKCSVDLHTHRLSACKYIETGTLINDSPATFEKKELVSSPNTYYIQDGLTFSGADGVLSVSCNSVDKKNLLCKEYKKKIAPGASSVFIRDYTSTDASKKQYAYLLDSQGWTLTECSFNPDNVLKSAIDNCKVRRDIHFPVQIVSGSVLSEANMLLLTGLNSEVYQCQYDSKNRLKGCKNTGLMNLKSTHILYDSVYRKVYFYSRESNKINACNIVEQSISSCYSINVDSSITSATVRDTAISSDFSHILFADKSTINYCSLNSWEPRLEKCIRLSDHFSNIRSIAYSKIHQSLLYVLDNKVIKACSIKNNKISCDTMNSNDNIAEMPVNKLTVSANYLPAGINVLPIKIKNKGGYVLEATYGSYNKDKYSKGQYRRTVISKKLAVGKQSTSNILAGSAVELHALSGHKKCIFVDKPGEINCTRSAHTMKCYHNGSSKKVINGPCPPTSFKVACTPGAMKNFNRAILYQRHSTSFCSYNVNEEKGKIGVHCRYCATDTNCHDELDMQRKCSELY